MATVGQALNPGYYWSGTKVMAGPGAPRYIGAVIGWEYWRAPADVFAPVSPYQPATPPPPPPPPSILPPAETTGGLTAGSPPPAPAIPTGNGGCGDCGSAKPPAGPSVGPTAPPVTLPAASTPVTVKATPAMTVTTEKIVATLRGIPWWVYALVVLVLVSKKDG